MPRFGYVESRKKNRRRVVYYNLTYTIFFGNLFWSSRTNQRHFCVPQKQDSNTMTIYVLINTIHKWKKVEKTLWEVPRCLLLEE